MAVERNRVYNDLTRWNRIRTRVYTPLNAFHSRIDINTTFCRLISIIVPITFFAVLPIGYHMIALNVPAIIVQNQIMLEFKNHYGVLISHFHLSVIWSFLISCQSIGALFSFLLVTPLENHFGTMKTLTRVNNLVLILGSAAFGLISRYTSALFLLVIGRLLIGLYTGICCALVPIFIHELAPKHLQGSLCCFVHISICAGSALGALFSLEGILGGPTMWTILLALPALTGISQIAIGYFVLEPPNSYIRKNNRRLAIESIRFYYGTKAFNNNLDEDKLLQEYQGLVKRLPDQISISEAFKDRQIFWGIILGMLVSMVQVFSGSMAAVSYSTIMLESVSFFSGFTPFVPILGSLLSILLTLPAIRLVETRGRKKLLIDTLWICAIANYLLVAFSLISNINTSVSWPSIAFVLSFFLYGVGYNLGVGPIAYFLPSELVPQNAVGVSMGLAVAINWLSTMLTTLLFYPIEGLIGGWSYLLFAIPTTLAAIYFRHFLLEDRQSLREEFCSTHHLSSNSSLNVTSTSSSSDFQESSSFPQSTTTSIPTMTGLEGSIMPSSEDSLSNRNSLQFISGSVNEINDEAKPLLENSPIKISLQSVLTHSQVPEQTFTSDDGIIVPEYKQYRTFGFSLAKN